MPAVAHPRYRPLSGRLAPLLAATGGVWQSGDWANRALWLMWCRAYRGRNGGRQRYGESELRTLNVSGNFWRHGGGAAEGERASAKADRSGFTTAAATRLHITNTTTEDTIKYTTRGSRLQTSIKLPECRPHLRRPRNGSLTSTPRRPNRRTHRSLTRRATRRP